MADKETYDQKRLRLKKEILSRAILEGRGPEAIRRMDSLYRNIRDTRRGSDDEIVGGLSASLTGGKVRATMLTLQEAGLYAASRALRGFNIGQALVGSTAWLKETAIVPGTDSIN